MDSTNNKTKNVPQSSYPLHPKEYLDIRCHKDQVKEEELKILHDWDQAEQLLQRQAQVSKKTYNNYRVQQQQVVSLASNNLSSQAISNQKLNAKPEIVRMTELCTEICELLNRAKIPNDPDIQLQLNQLSDIFSFEYLRKDFDPEIREFAQHLLSRSWTLSSGAKTTLIYAFLTKGHCGLYHTFMRKIINEDVGKQEILQVDLKSHPRLQILYIVWRLACTKKNVSDQMDEYLQQIQMSRERLSYLIQASHTYETGEVWTVYYASLFHNDYACYNPLGGNLKQNQQDKDMKLFLCSECLTCCTVEQLNDLPEEYFNHFQLQVPQLLLDLSRKNQLQNKMLQAQKEKLKILNQNQQANQKISSSDVEKMKNGLRTIWQSTYMAENKELSMRQEKASELFKIIDDLIQDDKFLKNVLIPCFKLNYFQRLFQHREYYLRFKEKYEESCQKLNCKCWYDQVPLRLIPELANLHLLDSSDLQPLPSQDVQPSAQLSSVSRIGKQHDVQVKDKALPIASLIQHQTDSKESNCVKNKEESLILNKQCDNSPNAKKQIQQAPILVVKKISPPQSNGVSLNIAQDVRKTTLHRFMKQHEHDAATALDKMITEIDHWAIEKFNQQQIANEIEKLKAKLQESSDSFLDSEIAILTNILFKAWGKRRFLDWQKS